MSWHKARTRMSAKGRGGSSRSGKRFWQVTSQDILQAMEHLRAVKKPKRQRKRRGITFMSIRHQLLNQGLDVTTQQVKVALLHAVQDGVVDDITVPVHRRYDLPDAGGDEDVAEPQPGCSTRTACKVPRCACQQPHCVGHSRPTCARDPCPPAAQAPPEPDDDDQGGVDGDVSVSGAHVNQMRLD